ncbi:MAG: hypothetical protein JNM99_13960 [Verrucomicrobiaceae bacterium]|nr:hypothetical protein [Verrucomicrobiaceae bacterium]
MMKPLVSLLAISAITIGIGSCVTTHESTAEERAFEKVQMVLETNCVHCHGKDRLTTMPPISDSRALAKLIGPKTWIIPGKPDSSRFYQVVSMPDTMPGVMPPTGHAISKQEVATLRQWIAAGAQVPTAHTIRFTPRGVPPRSR